MPYRPKVPCHQPGCPELVEPGKLYCAKHLPLHPEVTRPASKRGYGSRWQKAKRISKKPFPGSTLSGKGVFIMKYGGANLEKHGENILRMKIIMW